MNEILNYVAYYGRDIISLLFFLLILKLLFSKRIRNYHSHWNTLIENFNFHAGEFYNLLEQELQSHGIEDITIKRVSLKEGNMFSSKRMYLRVLWKSYHYDICAAPFGEGFFISWWLLHRQSIIQNFIARIPFLGTWLVRKLFPITYYRIDTALMFMTYAHASVQKVIKDITEEKGIRALSEAELKPILNDIFKR